MRTWTLLVILTRCTYCHRVDAAAPNGISQHRFNEGGVVHAQVSRIFRDELVQFTCYVDTDLPFIGHLDGLGKLLRLATCRPP